MNDSDATQRSGVDRPPGNLREALLANCRPQPAIPSVAIFFFFVLFPTMTQDPAAIAGGGSSWVMWLVAAGIVASCALAVGAGFCSVFPQLAWFILAWWLLDAAGDGQLPVYNQALLLVGMLVVIGMLVFQVWRVRTGKFVPTIREEE